MADGRHFENGFIAISQPGSKLCFHEWSHGKVQNFCKFKMADGHDIENRFFSGYIATIYCLTNAKFRTNKQNYRHRSHD